MTGIVLALPICKSRLINDVCNVNDERSVLPLSVSWDVQRISEIVIQSVPSLSARSVPSGTKVLFERNFELVSLLKNAC